MRSRVYAQLDSLAHASSVLSSELTRIHQALGDTIVAEVPFTTPPVAQQADSVLAEASPAAKHMSVQTAFLAAQATPAPTEEGWPETKCEDTKFVMIGVMAFCVLVIGFNWFRVPPWTPQL